MNDIEELEKAGIKMLKVIKDDSPVYNMLVPFHQWDSPYNIPLEVQNPNLDYLWARVTYTKAELINEIDEDNLKQVKQRGYCPLSASRNPELVHPAHKIMNDRIHYKGSVLVGKVKDKQLESDKNRLEYRELIHEEW